MPHNVFCLRGSTSIKPGGVLELDIIEWRAEDCDIPVEIIFDELDVSAFETGGSFEAEGSQKSGATLAQISHQLDQGRYTYLGKIAAIVRKRTIELQGHLRDRFYFELRSPEQEHGDATALPVCFSVRVPVAVADDGTSQFRDLPFQVRGDPEHRFEINVKIWTSGDHRVLAPTPNRFVIAGIIWTMPRLIPHIEACGRADIQPCDVSDDFSTTADRCVEHIRQRLTKANAIDELLDRDAYRGAVSSDQESWVRTVVKHLSGLPYARGQLAFGGTNEDWRSHLEQTGVYPACNVCDQLGDIIQWIRGVPHDYMGAGFQHRARYASWATSSERPGARWFADEAEAMDNIDAWAKPGASIFYQGDPPSKPHHESTILRTRGSGEKMLVQLFDYGHNLRGVGAMRGYVGSLAHVAQESGWMRLAHAVHNIRDRAFWGVGWCPAGTPLRDPPVERPLGRIRLIVEMRADSCVLREFTPEAAIEINREQSLDLPPSDNPLSGMENRLVSHLMYAVSALPDSETMKVSFMIENSAEFGGVEHTVQLLRIENREDGSVEVTPFPNGNPWKHKD